MGRKITEFIPEDVDEKIVQIMRLLENLGFHRVATWNGENLFSFVCTIRSEENGISGTEVMKVSLQQMLFEKKRLKKVLHKFQKTKTT